VAFSALTAFLRPQPAQALDIGISLSNTTPVVAWTSQFSHEYQLLGGFSATQIQTTCGRILTATGAAFTVSVSPTSDVCRLFGVLDGGWTFKVLALTNDGTGAALLRWSSETDGTYRVMRSTDLVYSISVLASNIPATAPVNTYTDGTANGNGPYFYWAEKQTNGGFQRTINAGGFYKLHLTNAGTFGYLCHYGFQSFDGLPHDNPSSVLGNQLPLNTTCSIYSTESGESVHETFAASGWSPDTNQLSRDRGFWILTSATAGTLYVSGEVPESRCAATTTIAWGLTNVIGYPYPVPIAWTNTTLAKNAVPGDWVDVYNPNTGGYYDVEHSNWTCPNLIITPGIGFFYTSQRTGVWTEVKPYTWP